MDADTFWENMQKGPADQCWPWTRARVPAGYGRVYFEGRNWVTSRLAYHLANGPFDPEICVLHRCDNPPCCNPDHLFLGTRGDNLADCIAKGRYRAAPHHGSLNEAAVLDEAGVARLRSAYATGAGIKELARRHGISATSIKRAISGRGWKHVDGAVPLGRIAAEKAERRHLAIALFRQGHTAREVASSVGITMSGAYHLRSRYINQGKAA